MKFSWDCIENENDIPEKWAVGIIGTSSSVVLLNPGIRMNAIPLVQFKKLHAGVV